MRALRFAASLFSLCIATAALSLAAPKVNLNFSQSLVENVNGKPVASPVDRSLHTGDVLRYTIVAKNLGTSAAVDLEPVGPVPTRFSFMSVVSSAPMSHAEYSLDGKSYSAHPLITVKDKDGKPKQVPAPLDLYRSVRWDVARPLPPHSSLTFAYEVRVK